MKLDKAYQPQTHEAATYKLWEDSGAFKPTNKTDKAPFSIILPPPNANGNLHLGHAMYVVEDIMVRFHRMNGRPTLWLPGADHAGIETQVMFERQLAKAGKSRFDLGRDEFYRQALAFTKTNMANMMNQLRSLGFSVDWSRFKFTLDPDIVSTVYDTFRRLHDDGYIYRGNRIVNWCPACRSGFADIEIKYREQIDPLYFIKYGPFVLATVRPETKFGDTAVAVHPKDERYRQYIGQEIEADGLLGKFKLKVIADEFVDPAFGTGVIKVTPAHDPNDWEIGLRHGLAVKQAIGTDGRLTELCGKYAGMTVADARQQVAHDLTAAGLMDRIEMDYRHSVAYHDRCGTLIEPLVTEQWWLKVEALRQTAIKAFESDAITMVPTRFKKVCLDWLYNLRDWNISRQNWFGIPIPVYYNASGDDTKLPYLIATDENEAIKYYGAGNYEAETDTFDTWFSSSQWPYATLMATGDMDRFYPTSVMETGRDILFLWVTRMAMLGLYRHGNVPFKTVYLHGLVLDQAGKKMSKSKGNGIDPLAMTAKYGTDALRLALTIGITPGNDGALSEQKIAGYRNFCNKLWNVARYALAAAGDYSPTPPQPLNLADRWILDMVSKETSSITSAIHAYRFSEAGSAIYALLWDSLADWYLEASKTTLNPSVLIYVLETILKLAHPFAPYVSEVIWQQMSWQKQNLITSAWPQPGERYADAAVFEQLRQVVGQIRHLKSEAGVVGVVEIAGQADFLAETDGREAFERLSGTKLVGNQASQLNHSLRLGSYDLYLGLTEQQQKQASQALQKRLADQRSYLARLEAKLANTAFVASAPAAVVADTRARQATAETEANLTKDLLQAIK